jgi:hypothetical protein
LDGELWDLTAWRKTPLGKVATYAFSNDARWLVVSDPSSNGTLVDLISGTRESIGPTDFAFLNLSPDSHLLVTRPPGGPASIRGLGSGAVKPLGHVQQVEFSGDGRFLFIEDSNRQGRLRDLASGIETSLGVLSSSDGYRFSDDGRWLVTVSPSQAGTLRDLASGSSTPLGQLMRFDFAEFSHNSRLVAVIAQGGLGRLLSLNDMHETPLGVIESASFSHNDRFLLTVTKNGNSSTSTLYDLPSGTQHALGEVEDVMYQSLFSDNDRYLVTRTSDDTGTLRDLATGRERRIGRIGGLGFSRDGRYLLIGAQASTSTVLLNLLTDSEMPLSGVESSKFSDDSHYLITQDAMGFGVLRDLRRVSPGQSRGVLDVCANGVNAVQPFPIAVRAARGPEFANISRELRGRPWNPCDWRGLGDGPEGWAQWWRLVETRLNSHERDYKCGEIDAAGDISHEEMQLCSLSNLYEAAGH